MTKKKAGSIVHVWLTHNTYNHSWMIITDLSILGDGICRYFCRMRKILSENQATSTRATDTTINSKVIKMWTGSIISHRSFSSYTLEDKLVLWLSKDRHSLWSYNITKWFSTYSSSSLTAQQERIPNATVNSRLHAWLVNSRLTLKVWLIQQTTSCCIVCTWCFGSIDIGPDPLVIASIIHT